MIELTVSRLKQILSYEPHTGLFYWIEPPKRHPRLTGYVAGGVTTGYVLIKIDGRKYKAHRLAWMYMTGEMPSKDIDHINGNPLDNRIENLRLATNPQNQANRRRNSGKRLPKGVRIVPSGRYCARIRVSGRLMHLGTFNDTKEASDAYMAAALANYGKFARAD